ncbi:uncharacterized protein DEA37_0008843 [Paragonimus westermani]|uniref:DUF3421 domain-containing protein n=1 Tax=Paragonimus westermani TaxID=34504 RepID=A0A5J4NVS7_9TREM|nr:uncharacterized protein DEA37_0008843 [Paragonimus westermani]
MARYGDGFQMTLSWVPAKDGHVPKHAIEAGPGVYVCRADHDGEKVPGKLHFGHPCAYFPYGGQEVSRDEYEVLVWMKEN